MLLSLVFAVMLGGATASSVATPPVQSAQPAAASVDETAPVAVPPASDKAMAYYRSGNVLWAIDIVLSFAMLGVILATGFSAKLRDWSQRVGRRWFFTLVIYYVLFNLITTVIDFPRAYYEEFVRQHAYGLSNQTFSKWWTDSLKSFAVSTIVGALVLWVPYLLLRKSPRRWWLYTALALIPFIVVGNLVAPIWIAPLFNKF